ncbi:potassium voltage-gated channel subfamily A member 6 [Hydra vulgaris]|uniref:Potassium voltage-gated channel subfamily A member 6 n=1 Tax=Hydra vulgaris TaxID=6087 RepID=A0ABM4CGM1_HYDVU
MLVRCASVAGMTLTPPVNPNTKHPLGPNHSKLKQLNSIDLYECNTALHFHALQLGSLVLNERRIKISVRGTIFETFERTLETYPNTLLGNIYKRDQFFDKGLGIYVLDRCVYSFDSVLFYYQSKGTLAKPPIVPREQFYEELNFYEIEGFIDERHIEDLQFLKQNNKKIGDLPNGNYRSNIWKFVNYFNDSFFQIIYTNINLAVTILSIIAYCLETVPSLKNNKTWIQIEIITGILFSFEFIITAYSSPNLKELRCSLNIILDFMSIIFCVLHVTFYFSAFKNKFAVAIQFVRVIRIFKLTKFSVALRLFIYTLYKCSQSLQVFFIAVGTFCFVNAALMFLIENEFNPDLEKNQFQSILDSMWYSIITATAVGYGDVVPTTSLGKLFGSFVAVTGIIIFCIQQPVLVNHFISIYYLPEVMSKVDTLRKRAIIQMRQTLLGTV